jgi:hypothetical protein
MVLRESTIIGGIRISVGKKLQGNANAASKGICSKNEIVEIRAIKVDEDRVFIGLYSDNTHKSWGSLDGVTPPYQGLWVDSDGLFNFFELFYRKRIIAGDFDFKKRNLKGMKCKILYQDHRQDQCFVEFDDNVGGGSADGLGKTGHCVALSSSLLESIEESIENKYKTKKKSIEIPDEIFDITMEQKPGKWLTDKESVIESVVKEKKIKDTKPSKTYNREVLPEEYQNKWKTDQILHVDEMKLEIGKSNMAKGSYVDFGAEPDFYDES